MERLRRIARPHYEIDLETLDPCRAPFLDIEVMKYWPHGSFCPELRFQPYIKPTARHIPLHHDSVHPVAVHETWPLAEMRRMKARSFAFHAFRRFRDIKLQRWSHFFLDPVLLETCRKWSPPFFHSVPMPPAQTCLKARVVLPWHPALRGLAEKLRKLALRWNPYIGQDIGFEVQVQVAWSSGSKPLMFVLRHLRV